MVAIVRVIAIIELITEAKNIIITIISITLISIITITITITIRIKVISVVIIIFILITQGISIIVRRWKIINI